MVKLTPNQKIVIRTRVLRVFKTGVAWRNDAENYPVGPLIAVLKSIKGVKPAPNGDTNPDGFWFVGPQYTWEWHFTYKGARYSLNGSGWEGGCYLWYGPIG